MRGAWFAGLLIAVMLLGTTHGFAADLSTDFDNLGSDDSGTRRDALKDIGLSKDLRAIVGINDFLAGNLYTWKTHTVSVDSTTDKTTVPALDPVTRLSTGDAPTADLVNLSPTRRERLLCRDALIILSFNDPDRAKRLAALTKIGDSDNVAALAPLRAALASEKDHRLATIGHESMLLLQLQDDTPEHASDRVAAISALGAIGTSRALGPLTDLSRDQPTLTTACLMAIAKIESWQRVARGASYIFSGISLGSILVLMALGLSIVFGLMGVINMAHGELMMIGAYATFMTQQIFTHFLPSGVHDLFFVVAIPVSFLAAGAVGLLIEATIVRFLYGRPLETLLATWGVSLILIQIVRLTFGDNIAVNSPSYLQGGATIATDIILPYNRLFIIVFCLACILGMYALIERTRLGLLLRSTMQNRRMAASLGVSTRRIDAFTFMLGSGLAGLAGCALTQIGGVSPDMGQNYIVDSFMVVVAGGVGKLIGAIVAGLSLGCMTKGLEPFVDAVWAKVLILGCVIVLLQWRPAGLFPAKGRLVDV